MNKENMSKKTIVINQNDAEYPQRLLHIKDAPKKLYVQGNYGLLNRDSISIVGTRKCTKYGEKCASIFAKELSKQGVCIVSGMAIGIDSISHINSMEYKGKTIAVLGSGFNYIFPKENYYLYEKILENDGCIVTEYPPETKPNKENFPRRNRIVSGLSMGVLIIEARFHSGTSITARLAKDQSKEVFCIPHPINTPTGYIPNLLIQNGSILVNSPQDILNYYSEEADESSKEVDEKIYSIENRDIKKIKYNKDKLISLDYQEIYDLIGELPISANEICKRLNKPIFEVTEALFMLEINELIENIPGNLYVRRKN